jgi:hypothetical protein
MTERLEKPVRNFSPAEANALLPLVRPIAEAWQRLACSAAYRAELLRSLPTIEGENGPQTAHGAERAAAMEAVDAAISQVDELRLELVGMGLAPQDPLCGHLLFPSADRVSGAYLSWMPADKFVANVMDKFEGPAARRPLADSVVKSLDRASLSPPPASSRRAEGAC